MGREPMDLAVGRSWEIGNEHYRGARYAEPRFDCQSGSTAFVSMSRRPARFTEADVHRALKAAERAGPDWRVEVLPDGTIRLQRQSTATKLDTSSDAVIVL
jgi:hypothetical protein